eukprot:2943022-Pleurochrysis_carterae.AAC.1
MCLPRLRRLRAWRSLRRAVRVATRARGFEAMCSSVHAARAGLVVSTGTAGESSVLVDADRWDDATASGPSGGTGRASRRTGRLHAGVDPCRLPSTAASVL